jgi:hypothetical protein
MEAMKEQGRGSQKWKEGSGSSNQAICPNTLDETSVNQEEKCKKKVKRRKKEK